MEQLFDFIKGFNIQTIISLVLIVGYFSRHVESKIEKQSERTDRLYEMFIDLLKEKKRGD